MRSRPRGARPHKLAEPTHPTEIAASILAATTVLISLPPLNLPPWAIFIAWAGTFAAGGPTREVLKRIWPTMVLGSTVALLIVLAFDLASNVFSGWSFTIAQMVIIFVLNGLMISTARVTTVFSFVPGMFLSFASFFVTDFGGFGPGSAQPLVGLGGCRFDERAGVRSSPG